MVMDIGSVLALKYIEDIGAGSSGMADNTRSSGTTKFVVVGFSDLSDW
jgi:hypothetical protein